MVSIVLGSLRVIPILNRLRRHEVILLHVISEGAVAATDYKDAQLRVSPPLLRAGVGQVNRGLDERYLNAVISLMQQGTVLANKYAMVHRNIDASEGLAGRSPGMHHFVPAVRTELVTGLTVREQLSEYLLLQGQALEIALLDHLETFVARLMRSHRAEDDLRVDRLPRLADASLEPRRHLLFVY